MEELCEFWRIAARLKTEPRRGWIQRLNLRNVESVADHTFGVAILSLFEGERRGYDAEKILTLALIHDLEEALIGDLTPWDKRNLDSNEVAAWKKAAINRILDRLPARRRRYFRQLWGELRTGGSPEARLVKQLDKLEMALQAREYERGGLERRKLADFYRSASRSIKDRTLKEALHRALARC
jgi:putative hydrolase of HD superfamily